MGSRIANADKILQDRYIVTDAEIASCEDLTEKHLLERCKNTNPLHDHGRAGLKLSLYVLVRDNVFTI